jgi:hypothetical protein
MAPVAIFFFAELHWTTRFNASLPESPHTQAGKARAGQASQDAQNKIKMKDNKPGKTCKVQSLQPATAKFLE